MVVVVTANFSLHSKKMLDCSRVGTKFRGQSSGPLFALSSGYTFEGTVFPVSRRLDHSLKLQFWSEITQHYVNQLNLG